MLIIDDYTEKRRLEQEMQRLSQQHEQNMELGLVNTTNQALNNECEQNKSLEYDVKLVKASGHSSESLQSPKQTLNFVSPFV